MLLAEITSAISSIFVVRPPRILLSQNLGKYAQYVLLGGGGMRVVLVSDIAVIGTLAVDGWWAVTFGTAR